eukprot:CAMPEP_0182419396 /NCGR_PEP_ID=MMETSP1167-20130531/3865_1 /TAXON_ID=2988 /ORGANISM="Mallomonas Sp, Strain CCMP3275" /LENGTH=489 /DNA_ID=CAMNT_0024594305 /DNA_START=423 /DNA_END=1892 /DNA_ORIENTATION=-
MIRIPSSRVDDGICDCCDGSDEGFLTKCPSNCDMIAASERALLSKLQSAYDKGSKIRNELLENMKDESMTTTEMIQELQNDVERAKSELNRIRAIRDEEEENEEKEDSERKGQAIENISKRLGDQLMNLTVLSPLLSHLFDMLQYTEDDARDALDALAHTKPLDTETETEMEHVDEHLDIVDDDMELGDTDEYASTPHYTSHHSDTHNDQGSTLSQDCVLKQYSSDPRVHVLCSSTPSDDTLRDFLIYVVHQRQVTKELQLLWGYYLVKQSFDGVIEFAEKVLNPVSVQDGQEIENSQNTCPSEFAAMPEVCSIDEDVKTLLRQADTDYKHPPAEEARQALRKADNTLRDAKIHLQNAEKTKRDMEKYGPEKLAFFALKGQCFEGKDGKFTYKLCMLETLEQSSLTDPTVRLGKFDSIIDVDGGSKFKILFKQGQHCHAFGPRTAEVEVSCGAENILKDAREPSTCFYSFQFETPAACTPTFAQFNGLY